MEESMHKITDFATYYSVDPLFTDCMNTFNTKDTAMQDRVYENLKIRFGFYIAKTILNSFSRESEANTLKSAIEKIIMDAGLTIRQIEIHFDIIKQFNLFICQCRWYKFKREAIRDSITTFMDHMKRFEDMLLFKPFLDGINESESNQKNLSTLYGMIFYIHICFIK